VPVFDLPDLLFRRHKKTAALPELGTVTGSVTRAGKCHGLAGVRVGVGEFLPLQNPYPCGAGRGYVGYG
jgi:hypothetical protein